MDLANEGVLSVKIASLLPLGGSKWMLMIVTAFVGGLVAGFAALSGSYLRSIKSKKIILITWSMKIFFQLIIFALITATSFSQTVSGIVRDDKGNPMPNASVLIKDKKGGTVCNVEGKYFLNLSPGKYTSYRSACGL